eukprot:PhM_4_TR675/c0_g1_i1/m.78860
MTTTTSPTPLLRFSPPDDVRLSIKTQKGVPHIVVYGSAWHPLAIATLKAAAEAAVAVLTVNNNNNVLFHLIDAQDHSEWYVENGLVVGVPVVQVYLAGKKMKFNNNNNNN